MRSTFAILFSISIVSSAADTLVLRGGTVWATPTERLTQASVLIEDGRISAVGSVKVPRGAQVLDCSRLTILAGFWNNHVHFFQRKWENPEKIPASELQQQIEEMLTRYGFTSVFDLGSSGAGTRFLRDLVERGEIRGPRIRTTGEAIVAPGAVPAPNLLRMLGNFATANHEVTTADQAANAARTILAAGGDGVKIHLQRPIPEPAIRAAIDVARGAGKPVFVHPSTTAEVLAVANAGVDILAHTTPFSDWDASVIPRLLEKKVAITPTISVWRFVLRHDRLSVQQGAVNRALEQLKAWNSAGGTVLFGNDLGAVEYDPTEEYTFLRRAGMSFPQILASLTIAPAARFGEGARLGQVAKGFLADLTVVDSIENLARVRYTIRDGKIIYASR